MAFLLFITLSLPLIAGTLSPCPSYQRIVSASVTSDEILWDLFESSERKKCVLSFSQLARQKAFSAIATMPAVDLPQKFFTTQPENIFMLNPDFLILSPYNRPGLIDELNRAKVESIVLKDPENFNDIAQNIELIAKKIGKIAAGKALVKKMLSTIDRKKKPAQNLTQINRKRVLLMGLDYRFPGKKTLFNEVCEKAGVKNITGGMGIDQWFVFSKEKLLTTKSDLLIFSSEFADTAYIEENPFNLPLPSEWKAYILRHKDAKVLTIPSRWLFSTSHYASTVVETLGQYAR